MSVVTTSVWTTHKFYPPAVRARVRFLMRIAQAIKRGKAAYEADGVFVAFASSAVADAFEDAIPHRIASTVCAEVVVYASCLKNHSRRRGASCRRRFDGGRPRAGGAAPPPPRIRTLRRRRRRRRRRAALLGGGGAVGAESSIDDACGSARSERTISSTLICFAGAPDDSLMKLREQAGRRRHGGGRRAAAEDDDDDDAAAADDDDAAPGGGAAAAAASGGGGAAAAAIAVSAIARCSEAARAHGLVGLLPLLRPLALAAAARRTLRPRRRDVVVEQRGDVGEAAAHSASSPPARSKRRRCAWRCGGGGGARVRIARGLVRACACRRERRTRRPPRAASTTTVARRRARTRTLLGEEAARRRNGRLEVVSDELRHLRRGDGGTRRRGSPSCVRRARRLSAEEGLLAEPSAVREPCAGTRARRVHAEAAPRALSLAASPRGAAPVPLAGTAAAGARPRGAPAAREGFPNCACLFTDCEVIGRSG